MAKRKAELEEQRTKYHDYLSQACSAEQEGQYRKAIELARLSWEYIDAMLQYERRYEKTEFARIESIDIVTRYAPFLLDFGSLGEDD